MKHSWFLVIGLAGCGEVLDAPPHLKAPKSSGATQGPTTIARCDAQKPFGTPTLLAGVNTADDELGFALTPDELTGFVDRRVQSSIPTASLLTAQRTTATAAFAMTSNDPIAAVDAEDGDELPAAAVDGYLIYFARAMPDGSTYLFAGIRDTTDDPFYDVAVSLDGSSVNGASPTLSGDGTNLYWVDTADGQLRTARRDGFQEQFTAVRTVSTMPLSGPVLSADELTLYYADGGAIMVSARPSTTDMFGPGALVASVSSTALDAPAALSADGCVLYLSSDRPGGAGGFDIWQAERPR